MISPIACSCTEKCGGNCLLCLLLATPLALGFWICLDLSVSVSNWYPFCVALLVNTSLCVNLMLTYAPSLLFCGQLFGVWRCVWTCWLQIRSVHWQWLVSHPQLAALHTVSYLLCYLVAHLSHHLHTHARTHTCTRARTHTHAHTHTRTHTRMHTRTHTHTHMHTHTQYTSSILHLLLRWLSMALYAVSMLLEQYMYHWVKKEKTNFKTWSHACTSWTAIRLEMFSDYTQVFDQSWCSKRKRSDFSHWSSPLVHCHCLGTIRYIAALYA